VIVIEVQALDCCVVIVFIYLNKLKNIIHGEGLVFHKPIHSPLCMKPECTS